MRRHCGSVLNGQVATAIAVSATLGRCSSSKSRSKENDKRRTRSKSNKPSKHSDSPDTRGSSQNKRPSSGSPPQAPQQQTQQRAPSLLTQANVSIVHPKRFQRKEDRAEAVAARASQETAAPTLIQRVPFPKKGGTLFGDPPLKEPPNRDREVKFRVSIAANTPKTGPQDPLKQDTSEPPRVSDSQEDRPPSEKQEGRTAAANTESQHTGRFGRKMASDGQVMSVIDEIQPVAHSTTKASHSAVLQSIELTRLTYTIRTESGQPSPLVDVVNFSHNMRGRFKQIKRQEVLVHALHQLAGYFVVVVAPQLVVDGVNNFAKGSNPDMARSARSSVVPEGEVDEDGINFTGGSKSSRGSSSSREGSTPATSAGLPLLFDDEWSMTNSYRLLAKNLLQPAALARSAAETRKHLHVVDPSVLATWLPIGELTKGMNGKDDGAPLSPPQSGVPKLAAAAIEAVLKPIGPAGAAKLLNHITFLYNSWVEVEAIGAAKKFHSISLKNVLEVDAKDTLVVRGYGFNTQKTTDASQQSELTDGSSDPADWGEFSSSPEPIYNRVGPPNTNSVTCPHLIACGLRQMYRSSLMRTKESTIEPSEAQPLITKIEEAAALVSHHTAAIALLWINLLTKYLALHCTELDIVTTSLTLLALSGNFRAPDIQKSLLPRFAHCFSARNYEASQQLKRSNRLGAGETVGRDGEAVYNSTAVKICSKVELMAVVSSTAKLIASFPSLVQANAKGQAATSDEKLPASIARYYTNWTPVMHIVQWAKHALVPILSEFAEQPLEVVPIMKLLTEFKVANNLLHRDRFASALAEMLVGRYRRQAPSHSSSFRNQMVSLLGDSLKAQWLASLARSVVADGAQPDEVEVANEEAVAAMISHTEAALSSQRGLGTYFTPYLWAALIERTGEVYNEHSSISKAAQLASLPAIGKISQGISPDADTIRSNTGHVMPRLVTKAATSAFVTCCSRRLSAVVVLGGYLLSPETRGRIGVEVFSTHTNTLQQWVSGLADDIMLVKEILDVSGGQEADEEAGSAAKFEAAYESLYKIRDELIRLTGQLPDDVFDWSVEPSRRPSLTPSFVTSPNMFPLLTVGGSASGIATRLTKVASLEAVTPYTAPTPSQSPKAPAAPQEDPALVFDLINKENGPGPTGVSNNTVDMPATTNQGGGSSDPPGQQQGQQQQQQRSLGSLSRHIVLNVLKVPLGEVPVRDAAAAAAAKAAPPPLQRMVNEQNSFIAKSIGAIAKRLVSAATPLQASEPGSEQPAAANTIATDDLHAAIAAIHILSMHHPTGVAITGSYWAAAAPTADATSSSASAEKAPEGSTAQKQKKPSSREGESAESASKIAAREGIAAAIRKDAQALPLETFVSGALLKLLTPEEASMYIRLKYQRVTSDDTNSPSSSSSSGSFHSGIRRLLLAEVLPVLSNGQGSGSALLSLNTMLDAMGRLAFELRKEDIAADSTSDPASNEPQQEARVTQTQTAEAGAEKPLSNQSHSAEAHVSPSAPSAYRILSELCLEVLTVKARFLYLHTEHTEATAKVAKAAAEAHLGGEGAGGGKSSVTSAPPAPPASSEGTTSSSGGLFDRLAFAAIFDEPHGIGLAFKHKPDRQLFGSGAYVLSHLYATYVRNGWHEDRAAYVRTALNHYALDEPSATEAETNPQQAAPERKASDEAEDHHDDAASEEKEERRQANLVAIAAKVAAISPSAIANQALLLECPHPLCYLPEEHEAVAGLVSSAANSCKHPLDLVADLADELLDEDSHAISSHLAHRAALCAKALQSGYDRLILWVASTASILGTNWDLRGKTLRFVALKGGEPPSPNNLSGGVADATSSFDYTNLDLLLRLTLDVFLNRNACNVGVFKRVTHALSMLSQQEAKVEVGMTLVVAANRLYGERRLQVAGGPYDFATSCTLHPSTHFGIVMMINFFKNEAYTSTMLTHIFRAITIAGMGDLITAQNRASVVELAKNTLTTDSLDLQCAALRAMAASTCGPSSVYYQLASVVLAHRESLTISQFGDLLTCALYVDASDNVVGPALRAEVIKRVKNDLSWAEVRPLLPALSVAYIGDGELWSTIQERYKDTFPTVPTELKAALCESGCNYLSES